MSRPLLGVSVGTEKHAEGVSANISTDCRPASGLRGWEPWDRGEWHCDGQEPVPRSDIVSPITEILIPRVSWLGIDVSNLTAAVSFAGEGTRHGQSPSHHGLGTRLLLSTCVPDIQGKQGGLTDLLETIRTWTSRSHGFSYLIVCPLLESGEGCTWLN